MKTDKIGWSLLVGLFGDIFIATLQRVEQFLTANLLTEQPELYETNKAILAQVASPGNISNVEGRSLQESLHNLIWICTTVIL